FKVLFNQKWYNTIYPYRHFHQRGHEGDRIFCFDVLLLSIYSFICFHYTPNPKMLKYASA
ncbi:hypothetical protein IJ670_06685, partial [bacterium]|nr:hypothetical protein [bacterium]